MIFPVLQHHLRFQPLLLGFGLLLCHDGGNIILVEYYGLLAGCLQDQLIVHFLLFPLGSAYNS